MATVLETLGSLNAYPVPRKTLESISEKRGLSATEKAEYSQEMELAKADVYMWLSLAPDVSQDGISYSFTDEQREELRSWANRVYALFGGPEEKTKGTKYGYKGSRL